MSIIRCAITGPLGNVGSSLLFSVASGALFGPETKVILQLLEIPELAKNLDGLCMELEDCAFPTLAEVNVGTDPYEMFGDVDCAFLVGAKPRGPGMERKDLLQENGAIFQKQGQALDKSAKKSAKILVVGNPCNTNCLLALKNAPSIPSEQFAALTRLDENRARSLLAKKAGTPVEEISSVTIWGNHSATQVPDVSHTTISGKSATSVVDASWIEDQLCPRVRLRGTEIIKVKGKSAAASAAFASIESMRLMLGLLPEKTSCSMAVYSQDNPYEIDKDLVFSFPCLTSKEGFLIVPEQKPNKEIWESVRASERELLEERAAVSHLI